MTTAPAHLAGNFAPVTEELTAHDLPITGTIPPELSGWYLRNGPNPHDAASGHWFLGDGMIHGVRLEGGRATSYRNRWVRTSTFTHGAVRWLPIEPCYVFHALNASDESHADGERIVFHVIRYPRLFADENSGPARPVLWRWTVDLTRGTVSEEQLDDQPCEFPRIDERLAGHSARYGHVTVGESPGAGRAAGELLRYDLRTGSVARHTFGPGRVPAEAAFAPADNRSGGPGWLLTYVYDAATDRSDLVVLDADDLAAPPVAAIHLPRRVPYGFHDNWLADR
ncbi:carotenoid oxygenase family protein [Streptomyces hesseae]|uniref:Dioxygenase n=1 Tax=Streptomyces hesseae TaxID=3075519 RepID=A0ABU2SSS0_9ACTN|nr:carotenoid oxygenase family protein [Streptomyces sp. DSM 40473]MDT0451912.1 carotenoid oxygenase family protein [Streptomyces sp. DSM 40473]